MPFWQFYQKSADWLDWPALLVQPSISAHRKWPEMVVSASTNQVWTKITIRSYAWSFAIQIQIQAVCSSFPEHNGIKSILASIFYSNAAAVSRDSCESKEIYVAYIYIFLLSDSIVETGAYGVPSKSQNPTVLGQGGPCSTQCSKTSWACRWHHPFGTNNYPPFWHSTQNQVFIPALDFLFFAKIRLEITNIWCGVSGNLSEQELWCHNGSKVVPRV